MELHGVVGNVMKLARGPDLEVTIGSSATIKKITCFLAQNYQARSCSTYCVPASILSSFHSPNNPIREVLLLPFLFYK